MRSIESRCRRGALLLALGTSLAGCAARVDMDAAYGQSLARWKEASRAQLVAGWGKPTLELMTADGVVLIYVVHHDIVQRGPMPTYTTSNGTPVIRVDPIAPVVPITCTTRFLLKDGVVASWTFEGLGCGAPE